MISLIKLISTYTEENLRALLLFIEWHKNNYYNTITTPNVSNTRRLRILLAYVQRKKARKNERKLARIQHSMGVLAWSEYKLLAYYLLHLTISFQQCDKGYTHTF